MKKFNYKGIDKAGRTVSGSTVAANEQEVKTQLVKFGFKKVRIKEEVASPIPGKESGRAGGQIPDAFVQKRTEADVELDDLVSDEEGEEYEWRRAEALARIRRFRRRQNIALVITLILLGVVAAYYIYDKMTEVPAPQPEIITRSRSELLSLKDVYVKGQDLVFVVYARNWNGNVRVDFQAWDAFENRIDFGTARMGFIGDHYGGSPEKSGAIKLKKSKFYEKIELLVSGDEDR